MINAISMIIIVIIINVTFIIVVNFIISEDCWCLG